MLHYQGRTGIGYVMDNIGNRNDNVTLNFYLSYFLHAVLVHVILIAYVFYFVKPQLNSKSIIVLYPL